MGIPAALRELFGADGSAETPAPSAIRPAVEIIARLSAERARLRSELVLLREELRQADAARGESGLREQLEGAKAELVRARSERDALAAELSRVRAERDALSSQRVARPFGSNGAFAAPDAESPLAGLLERLERALARFEPDCAAPVQAAHTASPARSGRVPVRERASGASEPATQLSSREARPALPQNSFMSALVRQNMSLRAGAPTKTEPAPPPAAEPGTRERVSASGPETQPLRQPSSRGLLGALVAENARLRRRLTNSGSASRARLLQTSSARRRVRETDESNGQQ